MSTCSDNSGQIWPNFAWRTSTPCVPGPRDCCLVGPALTHLPCNTGHVCVQTTSHSSLTPVYLSSSLSVQHLSMAQVVKSPSMEHRVPRPTPRANLKRTQTMVEMARACEEMQPTYKCMFIFFYNQYANIHSSNITSKFLYIYIYIFSLILHKCSTLPCTHNVSL